MLIRSSFKDYYDHIGHMYGGGDPSIMYLRDRLAPLSIYGGSAFQGTLEVDQKGIDPVPRIFPLSYNLSWMSVVGRLYLLVGNFGNQQILSERLHPDLWATLHRRMRWNSLGKNYVGVFSPYLVELSRKINCPVFTFTHVINRGQRILVYGDVPILQNVGLQKIVSAQQLYQDLSYFICNVIKESPDISPPQKMSDKEKILTHGFDIKKSFRHRV